MKCLYNQRAYKHEAEDKALQALQKAAHRAVYDELVAAELSWYLGTCPQGFDVVASSDTLVYFGELGDVLGAASAALRPGGRLVFTLEQASDEADVPGGYRIHPHGRYSHTEAYVRDSLSQAGFEVIEVGKERLRREGAAYVAGLLVAARLRRGSSVRPRRASSQENLASAIDLHQRGELQRAEPYYLAVLDAHEDNPEALHYPRLVCASAADVAGMAGGQASKSAA